MATYDMTLGSTITVGADSIAALPSMRQGETLRKVEAYLDFTKIVADSNYTLSSGDIFQLIEIPAESLVFYVGAEVMTKFDGTCTIDIDFAAGDDMIDGANVTSTGFCVKGDNGQVTTIVGSGASTYTQLVSTTDTIDVKVISSDSTVGVLRVFAYIMDLNAHGTFPATVDNDVLA